MDQDLHVHLLQHLWEEGSDIGCCDRWQLLQHLVVDPRRLTHEPAAEVADLSERLGILEVAEAAH